MLNPLLEQNIIVDFKYQHYSTEKITTILHLVDYKALHREHGQPLTNILLILRCETLFGKKNIIA